MTALPFADGTFDLVERGAIYIMGFSAGLRAWRPLLRRRGLVVVTEATWFTAAPSPATAAFWAEGYPPMTDVDTCCRLAEAAGYDGAGDPSAAPRRLVGRVLRPAHRASTPPTPPIPRSRRWWRPARGDRPAPRPRRRVRLHRLRAAPPTDRSSGGVQATGIEWTPAMKLLAIGSGCRSRAGPASG
ncbi:MAG: hypothetical protein R2713_02695 [Ilumatobacteraceae bacterium]